MRAIKRVTNVRVGHGRAKLTAVVNGDDLELQWCELYERGELRGCGPSLVGLSGDLLHQASMRLLDSPRSMLWSDAP